MELIDMFSAALQHISDFFHSTEGFVTGVCLLTLLRFLGLVVKAWGEPYAYRAYIGRGGRSPQSRQNSAPIERPYPRLLILKQ